MSIHFFFRSGNHGYSKQQCHDWWHCCFDATRNRDRLARPLLLFYFQSSYVGLDLEVETAKAFLKITKAWDKPRIFMIPFIFSLLHCSALDHSATALHLHGLRFYIRRQTWSFASQAKWHRDENFAFFQLELNFFLDAIGLFQSLSTRFY